MTKVQQLKIRDAITKAQEQGFTIQDGGFGNTFDRTCPIGALCMTEPDSESGGYAYLAATILECSEEQVWAFIYGFDGITNHPYNKTYYKFGLKLRKEFNFV